MADSRYCYPDVTRRVGDTWRRHSRTSASRTCGRRLRGSDTGPHAVALSGRAAIRPPPFLPALSFRQQVAEGHAAAGLCLAAARKAAADAALEIERGNDPRESRRAARQQAAAARADTVRAICESYITREGAKLRTPSTGVRLLGRHIYPTLGDRPIGSVRRGEIVALFDKIEDGGGAHRRRGVGRLAPRLQLARHSG